VPASTPLAVRDPGLTEQEPQSGASFEELLLQLKTRLEQPYRAVGREAAP
jgi:hypothetical protein